MSLRSAAAITKALSSAPKEGEAAGPKRVEQIEIDARGRWLVEGVPMHGAAALARLGRMDVWFLALHGGRGENGTIQGLLECAGARYTGSGVAASAVCMDKLAARQVAAALGLAVPAGLLCSLDDWRAAAATVCQRALGMSSSGWVIKPRRGGSSVGTRVVAPPPGAGKLEAARLLECELQQAWRDMTPQLASPTEDREQDGDDLLIEERIEGIEVSCAVLGQGASATALPPIEIQPRSATFFDYVEKYSDSGASEYCPVRSLDASAVESVQAASRRIHAGLGCKGYSRSDFIVRVAHGAASPMYLETNTLPGMTERSLLPKEAAAAGLNFRSLCLWILGQAVNDVTSLAGPRTGERR